MQLFAAMRERPTEGSPRERVQGWMKSERLTYGKLSELLHRAGYTIKPGPLRNAISDAKPIGHELARWLEAVSGGVLKADKLRPLGS